MEQEVVNGGVHVFEVIRALGWRPQWVQERIGMTRARWENLHKRRAPWRQEELLAILALAHEQGARAVTLTLAELIDPGVLVLQRGQYRRRRVT